LPPDVRTLFDDGHFPQATFEAFKYLDKTVEKHSGLLNDTGKDLMMKAFEGGRAENQANAACHKK
jgi:hypothetical protein